MRGFLKNFSSAVNLTLFLGEQEEKMEMLRNRTKEIRIGNVWIGGCLLYTSYDRQYYFLFFYHSRIAGLKSRNPDCADAGDRGSFL